VAQLKQKKYPASIVTSPTGTPGPRFHVVVGPYPSRAEADKAISSLKKDGYDNPIIKK
jgi:cell division protein FtsN